MWGRIFILALCIVASAQHEEPKHLKPGALVGHLGRVALVEDVMWVSYPYATLRTIPPRLREVLKEINTALTELKTEAFQHANSTNWDDPLSLLKLYFSRLEFVNDTISLALETYMGLEGPARSKRAWLEGLGQLAHDVFGTAMDSDVQELRHLYNELTNIASENNRAVQINCQRLAKLDRHVKDLGLYAQRLGTSLNTVFETLDSMYHFMVLNQVMPALENSAHTIIHTNQQIITNVVDAVHGRVTPALFPVHDFKRVIEIGEQEYGLKSLFSLRGIQHYYAVTSSFVTTDSIVIHVPFKSRDVLNVHQLEPFPFLANDTLMVLDLPPSIVVISADYSLSATASLAELQQCKTASVQDYFCPALLFAFLPVTGGICKVVLTQVGARKALELCPYTTLLTNHYSTKPSCTTTTFLHQTYLHLHHLEYHTGKYQDIWPSTWFAMYSPLI